MLSGDSVGVGMYEIASGHNTNCGTRQLSQLSARTADIITYSREIVEV